jgi:hypothetical protein
MRCHTLTFLDVHICAALAICSAAPLEILGVDWGLDCLQRRLDWCNGENTGSWRAKLANAEVYTTDRHYTDESSASSEPQNCGSCCAVANAQTYAVICQL